MNGGVLAQSTPVMLFDCYEAKHCPASIALKLAVLLPFIVQNDSMFGVH
jgi:hypothetical protein